MTTSQQVLAILTCSIGLALGGCEQIEELSVSSTRKSCDTQREVAGWTVSSGLEQEKSSSLLISKWEVRRNFAAHFGIRIAFDTSRNPEPYLVIWHDYKTGEFNMRMPDGAQLRTRLNANYAVTQSSLRPVDVDALRNGPVRIEHTTHEGKWRVYQTDGLPEAIAAAEADLKAAKQKLVDKECAA